MFRIISLDLLDLLVLHNDSSPRPRDTARFECRHLSTEQEARDGNRSHSHEKTYGSAQMKCGTAEENGKISRGTVSRSCHFAASWAGMNEHAKAQVWQEVRTLSPLAEGTMPESLLLELWRHLRINTSEHSFGTAVQDGRSGHARSRIAAETKTLQVR